MYPPAAAAELERFGHDAHSVAGSVLAGSDDEHLYELAAGEDRVMVTENFADYAFLVTRSLERGTPRGVVAFVSKSDLPSGTAMCPALARRLDTWAGANPSPPPGTHWP